MKYITAIILAFALSGCYQKVDTSDLYVALKKCKTIDNIQYIGARFDAVEITKCIKPEDE